MAIPSKLIRILLLYFRLTHMVRPLFRPANGELALVLLCRRRHLLNWQLAPEHRDREEEEEVRRALMRHAHMTSAKLS